MATGKGADDFLTGIAQFEQQFGEGVLEGSVTVNQAYAQNQHETLSFQHTVGQAKYLEEPLMDNAVSLLSRLAESVITEDGSDIKSQMIDTVEDINKLVEDNAPQDTGELYLSGNPRVTDGGQEIYNRPPFIPRGDYH